MPIRAEITLNLSGCDWISPDARRIWPAERSRADERRRVMREMWKDDRVDGDGERRSDRVPVRIRARVEVRATMEMWVAGVVVVVVVDESLEGDSREPMIVPSCSSLY